jgi:putative SOS response-associated peptidase YedK
MAFAGIWETWMDRDGGEIETAAIVTVPANTLLTPIHDRMPALIEREDFATWLEPDETEFERATALLKPAPENLLEAYEVSPRVNKFENDAAENITPVPADTRVS